MLKSLRLARSPRTKALIGSARNLSQAILLIVACLFLLRASNADGADGAVADETPEEMLSKLIAEVKSSGSPIPILERVDWKTAFAETLTDDRYRAAIGVKSPEELKSFYRSVFENPNALMKERVASKMDSLPPAKQAALEVLMMRVEATMKEHKASEMEKLRRSEFKITGSRIEGDKATVDFDAVLDGETKTQTVKFIKVDGRWRFPNLLWVKAPLKAAAPPTVTSDQ